MGDRMLAPWKKGRDPHPQTARMGPLLNTDDNSFKDEYLQSGLPYVLHQDIEAPDSQD